MCDVIITEFNYSLVLQTLQSLPPTQEAKSQLFCLETWNVRNMFETTKTAQVISEMESDD